MEPINWSALFAGDVLIQKERKSFVSDRVRSLIAESAIASVNLEAPVHTPGAVPIQKAGPILAQHPSAPALIQDAGFTVLNMANNHAYDFGEAGIESSIQSFPDLHVIGAGVRFADAYEPKEIVVGETRVGMLALAESEFGALTEEAPWQGGYAWVNHPSVNAIVRSMREAFDVVIVQVHAGIESFELPLPEWRARYKELVDLGADAVIASHTHVVQGMEQHRGKPIFYSLGNFCFDKEGSDATWNTGLMVQLRFEGSKLASIAQIPVRVTNGIVDLFEDAAYADFLAGLSNALNEESYMPTVNKKVLQLWNDVYKVYYINAFNTLDPSRSLLSNMKAVAKFILGRTRIDRNMLLHNMKIESHRYAIVRALTLLESGKGSSV